MSSTLTEVTLRKPDDWHLHLRNPPLTRYIAHHTADQFGRAIVMPNLRPPVTTVDQALQYRQQILECLPADTAFDPKMLLYLTDKTTEQIVKDVAAADNVMGFKLYPQGATTNSDSGVSSIEKLYPVLACMEENDVVLAIHGEVVEDDIDIFDREKVFIETVLQPIQKRFPNLRCILEHITTEDAVQYVQSVQNNLAATITAHHLHINRNHMLVGGIQPHHYCLPVAKRELHRQALVQAAVSGDHRFFLGTDSAPHEVATKESSCGCAGVYTAHAAIELYAEVFASQNKLERLEDFASRFGPEFYRLPLNQETITLRQEEWQVPDTYPYDQGKLVPFRAGKTLSWKLVH